MDIYPIILLICFLGIFVGAIVSFFVPEELKPLKKYFKISQKIIIALILIAIVYFTQLNFIYTIILFLIVGFLLSFENYTKYLYFASPIALYISQTNNQFMLIESFLIFFWSFIIAPIHIEKYEKKEKFKKSKIKMEKELFYNNIWFLIIGLLIWLVFYFKA